MISVFLSELRRVTSQKAAFSVLILSMILYALFYPQPYLNEALRNVPIAVVDKDGTATSRLFAQLIDATPDIEVANVLPDLVSAEREVYLRHTFGVLVIPQHFERDLLHGRPSPVALYSDASYFLLNQRMTIGVSAVAKTMGAEIETARLVNIGIDPVLASAAADPMPLTAQPLFNPQGGYATYILPAAFVLLLQQTLLIGVGLLGTLPGAVKGASAVSTVGGKLLAYSALEVILLPAYLIVLPYLYGLPRLGSVPLILLLGIPFVLSVGALGLVIAALFRKPLTVQLAMAAVGMPFMFLSGFSWPSEAIPPVVNVVARLLPSTSAIDGFVRISQLGASLYEVRADLLVLSTLAVVYTSTAVYLESRMSARSPSAARSAAADFA
ncbi:ABC transporter permease [Bradyrhizobium sp. 33ap4]|uniref:ABC transporter permease n=1 Tax=Bradyrhizobium sp. 33ap4 TaxID=3061630 RepID=UPI00292E38EB|nr:ABC transporter permease [Bradyrhizobium sp. 33ap4]